LLCTCYGLPQFSYHVRIGSVVGKKCFGHISVLVPFFTGGVIIVSHDERLIRDVGCQVGIRNKYNAFLKNTWTLSLCVTYGAIAGKLPFLTKHAANISFLVVLEKHINNTYWYLNLTNLFYLKNKMLAICMSFIHVAEGLRLRSWGFTRVGEAYSFLCGKNWPSSLILRLI
jgi:hypothetical protein